MSKYRTIEIDSWADYQRLVGGSEFRTWAFRGQQSARWKLFSTISRYFKTFRVKPEAWSRQELRVNRIFRRKAHLYLSHVPDRDDDFQWLALMQHHGAPTRLLDFTWSPFVAAFFALEAATEPAAVWGLCVPRLLGEQVTTEKGGVAARDLRLNDAGHYDRWFIPNNLRFAVQGEPLVMNQRLVAQSATFVVPGVLDRPVERIIESYRDPQRTLAKIVLDTERIRDDAMFSLYSMNITNATLFPGLDGMARSLAYELEHHWEYNPKTLDVHPDFLLPQRGAGPKHLKRAEPG
ncbi:MAG: FRG domain-containing protein [Gemmatimonadetes bacterium]|nr:FRG domain-containing protein [Gemmatimonadota bacterium]